MTALSLQLRYYAAAISIMAAVEVRFAESKASLVELSEVHDGFTITAICGEYEGEDVQGFIIFDANGEVLDAGGYYDELLIELEEVAAANAEELENIGFEEGDVFNLETHEGVDAQGFPLTVATEYGVNDEGDETATITRTVSNGEGLESGTITTVVRDSDDTVIFESVTDLDGNALAGDADEGDAETAEPFVDVVEGYEADGHEAAA